MAMKIIDFETIRNLSISPADCVKWVETALRMNMIVVYLIKLV